MKGHNVFKRNGPGILLTPDQDEYDDALARIFLREMVKTPVGSAVQWQGLSTYCAVVFKSQTLPFYCSLFYDVLVFSQEIDEDTVLEATRDGLLYALGEEPIPPLPREDVEERARQDEKEGILPKGWRVAEINVNLE